MPAERVSNSFPDSHINHDGRPVLRDDVTEGLVPAVPTLQVERKKRTVIREDIGSVDGLHYFKSFGGHRSLFSANALTVNRRCGLECQ
jgi:hypothetical protein